VPFGTFVIFFARLPLLVTNNVFFFFPFGSTFFGSVASSFIGISLSLAQSGLCELEGQHTHIG
jgi:hypothetical protein